MSVAQNETFGLGEELGVDRTVLEKFVDLAIRKAELEDELNGVKTKLDGLQGVLADAFLEAGIQRVTIKDRTVHLAADFVCSKQGGVAADEVCEVLRANGLSDLVGESYNASALKSRVKELVESGNLPDALARVLFIKSFKRVRVCKA